MKTDKLYLVGFMGAGKTTVGRALGRRLGWRVDDIDELIEARERRSVAEISPNWARRTSARPSAKCSIASCRTAKRSWPLAAAPTPRPTTGS